MDANIKVELGLKAYSEDEEIVRAVIQLIKDKGLTVNRASLVLGDAQILLPYVAKII